MPTPRKVVRLPVTLTFEGSGQTVEGTSENISETGVLVRSPVTQPEGTTVRMEFEAFEAKGQIIWTKELTEGVLLGMRIVSMGWEGWEVIRGLFESSGEGGQEPPKPDDFEGS